MMCTLGLSAYICNLLVAASDALASSCAAKLAAVRAAGMPSAGLVKASATELAAEAARANACGKSPCQGVAEAVSLSWASEEALRLRWELPEDDFALDSCLSSLCPGASFETRELSLGAILSWFWACDALSLLAKSAACSAACALSAWIALLVAAKLCR